MTRSNSPATHGGAWAQRQQAPEQNYQAPADVGAQWAQQPQQPAHYPAASHQHAAYAQHQGAQDQGYGGQQPAQGGNSYAPLFNSYQPQAPAARQHAPQHPQTGYAAQPRAPLPSQHDLAAYGGHGTAPRPDPRGYDLGSYMPNGGNAHETAYRQPDAQAAAVNWALHQGYVTPAGHNDPALAGYEDQYAHAQGSALEQAYGEEDLDYEEETPRRSGRAMLILTALIGAIGLGGALAYGYKSFLAPGEDGTPPLVKGLTGPARTKPADAGGKQFAHSDSKIMGRLGDSAAGGMAGAAAAVAASEEADATEQDPAGTRKVQTVVIGRDGSVTPPAPRTAPESMQPAVSVPGLMVVDGFGGRAPPAAAAPAAPSDKAVAVNPAAAPDKPVVIAKATPPPKAEAPRPPAKADAPAPDLAEPSPAAAPKKAPPADKPAATPAPAAPSGANGYVAVLASVPASSNSRIDALKQFADMQQKYGELLQSKTPDVQEANLGAKGTYHRLLVGPPGSREQASSLCGQLKSAGYNDCWVTAY